MAVCSFSLFRMGVTYGNFEHPTIRDAFNTLVAEDIELMDLYIAGAPIEKLCGEVSCGDVGIQGVKVIIPVNRYDMVMKRLETLDCTKWYNEWTLHRFFAHRCDREFLAQYIGRYPQFISSLRVGSYIYAVSDIEVIVRLHECGLLPEQKRIDVVSTIRDLAVETPDAGFLRRSIRNVFTENELSDILDRVRIELLPNLDDTIDHWRGNCDNNDPAEYFDELTNALDDYHSEFADDQDADIQITTALRKIKQVIAEMRSEQPQQPDSDDYYGKSSSGGKPDDSRSVFDDVNQ